MSTRGCWGFVIDGEEKLAYNHSDSYPRCLGKDLLAWLRGVDIDALKDRARAVVLVDQGANCPAPIARKLADLADNLVGGSTGEWYNVLRLAQGDPELTLTVGYMTDDAAFCEDSMSCEWAYVIDLDHERFEVYGGWQTAPHTRGRFANRTDDLYTTEAYRVRDLNGRVTNYPARTFYPVALIAAYALRELPDEEMFLRQTKHEAK